MKKLLVGVLLLFNIHCYSQLTTIVNNEYNEIIDTEYNEVSKLHISVLEKITYIEVDLDGNGDGEDNIIFRYKLDSGPTLSWNYLSQTYNIIFTLKHNNNSPVGGLIDFNTKSIMLFYGDGSSVLYMGEGVNINI